MPQAAQATSLVVHLTGRQADRVRMSNPGVYATDASGAVVARATFTAATTAVPLPLRPGVYRVFALFTLDPVVYVAEAEGVAIPATTSLTLDLDLAREDDIVAPPP